MIVCLCKSVSDRQVASAIADGACSVEQIVRCTGAGTGCGTCRGSLSQALQERQERPTMRRRLLPLAQPAWFGA
jgi:bacterioferritin-associated ferredoxin